MLNVPLSLAFYKGMELTSRKLSYKDGEKCVILPIQVENLLKTMECNDDLKMCVKNELYKWRNRIEEYILSRQCSHPSKKQCVFVLGPMGVGKSTIIQKYLKTNKKYELYPFVDTDEIMASLPGFHLDSISSHYPCARMIGILLTEWLYADEISFIAEGTCVNWKALLRFIKEMKSNGYTIDILFPEKPLSIVISQAESRSRKLSKETVISIYNKSMHGCLQLRIANENHSPRLFNVVSLSEL